ncbi:hypothetical protein VTN00DRAFT_7527 [Thermoascus crustaceus]|uniref:uncharacterized protein n=1 Tax=Thermoascus crustaceus TaxID=5088 RepID=UPI00374267DE
MLPPQQYTPIYPCDDPPELEVRMLYRELNPDPRKGIRTVSRERAGLNPLILIFQHWAVEVGSSCSGRWYRYELQYYREGSRLRVTPSDEEDIERMNYEEMPHVVKQVFRGKTRLSFGQISDIAQCIISKRRRYILGVSDCHNFAIELINQILTFRNMAFMGVKLGESIIRRTFKPIFLGVTRVLEWAGKIRDPLQSGIDWCQGWFVQHDDDDRRIQYNPKRHYDDDDDDDDDDDYDYDDDDVYTTLEQQDVAERYVWK